MGLIGWENKRRGARGQRTADRELMPVWFWLGSSRSRRSCGCSSDEESSAGSLPFNQSSTSAGLNLSFGCTCQALTLRPPHLSPPANVIHGLCSGGDLLRQRETGEYLQIRQTGGGLSSATTAHSPPLVNHCSCDRKDGGRRHESQRGEGARPCAFAANYSGY